MRIFVYCLLVYFSLGLICVVVQFKLPLGWRPLYTFWEKRLNYILLTIVLWPVVTAQRLYEVHRILLHKKRLAEIEHFNSFVRRNQREENTQYETIANTPFMKLYLALDSLLKAAVPENKLRQMRRGDLYSEREAGMRMSLEMHLTLHAGFVFGIVSDAVEKTLEIEKLEEILRKVESAHKCAKEGFFLRHRGLRKSLREFLKIVRSDAKRKIRLANQIKGDARYKTWACLREAYTLLWDAYDCNVHRKSPPTIGEILDNVLYIHNNKDLAMNVGVEDPLYNAHKFLCEAHKIYEENVRDLPLCASSKLDPVYAEKELPLVAGEKMLPYLNDAEKYLTEVERSLNVSSKDLPSFWD